jgi:hypothetical protein
VSWWEITYALVAAAIFVLIFREGEDDPFAVRVFGAAALGLFWGALLILFAVMLLVDGAVWLTRKVRK